MSQAGINNRGVFPPFSVTETITGNSGGPVGPDFANNINLLGTGVITVAGNPGTNTLTITPSGAIASSFPTDLGTATPAFGVLNIFGTGGIATSGSGNTVTINGSGISTNITLTGDSGGPLVGNSFKFTSRPSAGYSTSFSGAGTTLTLNLTNAFNNTFLGKNCGNTTGGGGDNIGIGVRALENQTNCSSNIAIGDFSLNALTQGNENIAIGVNSLAHCGQSALNIAIGANSPGNSYSTTESSNILFNSQGVILDNNTLRIGQTTGSGGTNLSRAFICGIDGVNVGSVAKVVTMDSDQLGTATITAGSGITVTPGANTITISSAGADILAYTNVNTSPYVVLSTDEYLSVDASSIAITLQFPNAPAQGRVFYVKDRGGNAAANNITITSVGGAIGFDGGLTYVMNSAYQSVNLILGQINYEIF